MIASELIRAVSRDLNDQEAGYEYEHWSYAMLKQYLREALIELSQKFYELFIKRFVVRVEPGGVWQRACCDCDQILRIVGETDETGKNILRTLSRVTDNPDNEWPVGVADICYVAPEDYKMVGATISNSDGHYFRVIPAVPADGPPHYIALECYTHMHDVQDGDEIYWRFIPVVVQWMLGRAYQIDGENNSVMAQLSQQCFQQYELLWKNLRAALDAENKEKDFERSVRAVSNGPAG